MIRSLLARRWVTGVSIVMLLLCQTAAVTLAYATARLPQAVQAVATEGSPACHDTAQDVDESAPSHGCQDRCPSRDFSPETSKTSVDAVAVVALPMFIAGPAVAATIVTAPHRSILTFAAPPPLRLVYCRLLN